MNVFHHFRFEGHYLDISISAVDGLNSRQQQDQESNLQKLSCSNTLVGSRKPLKKIKIKQNACTPLVAMEMRSNKPIVSEIYHMSN